MLKLENITISINNNTILKPFSTHLEKGDFVVIIGHNGSGKSTLLNSISGKIKTTNGKILLKSIPIQSLNKRERSKLISSLDQNPEKNCVPSLTVKENIALALLKEKKASLKNGLSIIKNSKVVKQINELFNDENILDKKMSELSGGQRQLIAFLMATAILPKILILDEPTAALDPKSSIKMAKLIDESTQKHKHITLMVTHDIQKAKQFGNKLWIVKNGRIKQISKKEKTFSHEEIQHMLN
ncbi:ATP-binding cassette domain-containing protein [bacterium]|jgi:putative tryptophan/tyrosine transport system ATP-binding protein|nr:ATP-binding cassette domain-containing protein [bacterium]